MSNKPVILRCYAEKDNDSWFAICIDLNLHSRQDTFEQARSDLESQIKRYIEEAITVDKDHFDDLIPRRAPFYFYGKYYWYRFLLGCHLIAANMAAKQPFEIEEQIPQHV